MLNSSINIKVFIEKKIASSATVIHGANLYSHSFLDLSEAGSFTVSRGGQFGRLVWLLLRRYMAVGHTRWEKCLPHSFS